MYQILRMREERSSSWVEEGDLEKLISARRRVGREPGRLASSTVVSSSLFLLGWMMRDGGTCFCNTRGSVTICVAPAEKAVGALG